MAPVIYRLIHIIHNRQLLLAVDKQLWGLLQINHRLQYRCPPGPTSTTVFQFILLLYPQHYYPQTVDNTLDNPSFFGSGLCKKFTG